MKSILVIGGGLIGAASAMRLQQAGIRTTLIDPGDKRRAASYGNAGHLGSEQVMPWSAWSNVWRAPGASFAVGGPLDFRWSDAALIAPWARRFLAACEARSVARGREALKSVLADTIAAWQRLARDVGAPEMALPHGHVTAWTSKRAADLGRDAASRTDWGAVTWRDLSAAELERYAPVMKRLPRAGILFNGTGQVRDPQGARDAILTQFVRQGGDVVEGNAEVIDANGRVLLARRTLNSPHFDGERGANFKSKAALENFESKASLDLKCDTSPDPTSGSHLRSDALGDRRVLQAEGVLIAAGAWSGALMRQLGQAAPLIGERGYSVQSAEHAWPEDLPTTVFEQHFVVFSRFSSGLRATSCIEFGAPSAPGDPRKWRLLEKRIAQLGVKFSKTPDRWVGPRPTLPDYVPAIGRLQRAPNVLYAFGHAHLGLTMSAVTAELIAALATERAPTIDLRAFAVERFS